MRPPPYYRGGSGPPLVLIHGFTDTWRTWTPVLPALAAHHEVLALTLPGHHGGEPWPEAVEVSASRAADAVESLLGEHGIDRAHLVGNSLGGWIALALAGRGKALSVVGVCPAGGWIPGSREERAIFRYFQTNDRRLRAGRPLVPLVARQRRLRRLALRDLIAYPDRVSPEAALVMFRGAAGCTLVKAMKRGIEHGEHFGDLGPIDVPVRIAYGTADRLIRWPSHYIRMRELLPDVEYFPLEGLGHLPMWDDPELVAAAILDVTAPSRGLGGPAGETSGLFDELDHLPGSRRDVEVGEPQRE